MEAHLPQEPAFDASSLDPESDDPARAEVETRSLAVAAAAHGQRLDKLLVSIAPEFSRSHLQTLIASAHVTVDGAVAAMPSRRLKVGQRVVVALVPTEESLAFRPEPIALNIVHEDADLLVIDKPAGLVVHPAPGNWSGTLLNGLLAHHAGAAHLPRAGIVHRLDKDTSGVMVVGKTLAAVTALTRDIAARRVHRSYLALAHGEMQSDSMTIEAPIGRDPGSRIRMAVVASGKPARTDIERLAVDGGISALRCTLHTGRTHQIRVHLASRGHPLVADATYGGRPALSMVRQALHAARLSFVHPITGHLLDLRVAMPDDLAAAWAQVAGVFDPADG